MCFLLWSIMFFFVSCIVICNSTKYFFFDTSSQRELVNFICFLIFSLLGCVFKRGKIAPFAVSCYAILTANFHRAHQDHFYLEAQKFLHSILRHLRTFSALPMITFRKLIIFGTP